MSADAASPEAVRGAVTALLDRVGSGDRAAASELLPLVYGELRRLARARMARLPPGQTLQATALVHEAYLELVARGDPGWQGRAHFFGAAAQAMHDVAVGAARRRLAAKRGGGAAREDIDDVVVACGGDLTAEDTLAVSEALAKLRAAHPRRAEVALLRTFAGATEEEIAHALSVSPRTVEREWRFARAWLSRALAR